MAASNDRYQDSGSLEAELHAAILWNVCVSTIGSELCSAENKKLFQYSDRSGKTTAC